MTNGQSSQLVDGQVMPQDTTTLQALQSVLLGVTTPTGITPAHALSKTVGTSQGLSELSRNLDIDFMMEDLGAHDGGDLERRFLEIKNIQHLTSERTMQLPHKVGHVRNVMAELQKSMQTLVEIVTPSLIEEERVGVPRIPSAIVAPQGAGT